MQCCGPSPPSADRSGVPAAGPAAPGLGCRATRAKCTETGQLSSWGVFLSRAAVLRHIAASKQCRAAKLQVGIREILVDVRTSDVMAGAGGGAGPAPDVQHQPEGTMCRECVV